MQKNHRKNSVETLISKGNTSDKKERNKGF